MYSLSPIPNALLISRDALLPEYAFRADVPACESNWILATLDACAPNSSRSAICSFVASPDFLRAATVFLEYVAISCACAKLAPESSNNLLLSV